MKVVVGLLLAVAVCSTVGLPAGDPKSETEYVTRNEDDFKDFAGVVDTGADLPSPFDRTDFGSADSFFSGISDFMRRFRERVFGDWWRSIPTLDIGNLDPSKGNSTSEVKVINGHRVEINNTVYTTNDESGNAIYKVRVVNVRPLDEDEDTTTAGPEDKTPEETDKKETKETKEREPLDNEVDNVFGATEVKDLNSSANKKRSTAY